MDTDPQPVTEPTPEIKSEKSLKLFIRRFGVIGVFLVLGVGFTFLLIPRKAEEIIPAEEELVQDRDQDTGQEEIYASYFKPLPAPPFSKLAKTNSSGAFYQNALKAYDQKQYKQAIELFQQALDDPEFASESGAEASLFLGISLLETKQPLPALEILEPYELHPDIGSEVRWYQALGFIQLNQRENVLHTLFSIARNPEHPHALDAKRLLGEFVPYVGE